MRISNTPGRKNKRRLSALEQKTAQLAGGYRPTREGNVVLTEKEKKRLRKEIEILKSRTVSQELVLSTKNKKYRGAR